MVQQFSELQFVCFVSPPDTTVLIPGTKSSQTRSIRSLTFRFGISPNRVSIFPTGFLPCNPMTFNSFSLVADWPLAAFRNGQCLTSAHCPPRTHSLGRLSFAVQHQRRLFLPSFQQCSLKKKKNDTLYFVKVHLLHLFGVLKKSIPILISTGDKEPKSLTMHEHRKLKKMKGKKRWVSLQIICFLLRTPLFPTWMTSRFSSERKSLCFFFL